MMNNHRHNKRIEMGQKLDVVLYSYGKPVASGRINNLSAGGVFIETAYRPNSCKRYIEFVCVSDDGKVLAEHRVKALIIHRTQQGFGLMTDDIGSLPGLIRRLLNTSQLRLLHQGVS
ncbi:MAG: hypothetical protein ACN4GM_00155 [Gammaproteobacteria bacterium]